MPTLIFYKCSKCKNSLGTQDAYYSIGQPYIICPICNTANIIAKHRNEWDLKTPIERLAERFMISLIAVLVGAGLGILCAEVIKYFGFTHGYKSYIFFIPLGIVGGYWHFFREFNRNIQESRARLKDNNYITVLKHLKLYKE
jgi:DNA-directed RNA polymerase subunit RPC12/RpoP